MSSRYTCKHDTNGSWGNKRSGWHDNGTKIHVYGIYSVICGHQLAIKSTVSVSILEHE